jgi:dTDP-4-dehydrorhamnose reductase
MKILITGSNGLLGQKIINSKGIEGRTLLAVSRGPCRVLLQENVRYESCDLVSQKSIM